MKALLVDDDPDFRTVVQLALESESIEYVAAADANQALAALKEVSGSPFDCILLDIEMPGPSGLDLLLSIREMGDEVPVIFISGRGRTEERASALRMGADDYMVKPIEVDEMLARIEAVQRRRRSLAPLVFGDLRLDLAMRRAYRQDNPIHLSPKEFDLLLALAQAGGEIVSREDLLLNVWDLGFDPGTNLLDVHVGRLRKKIDRFGRPIIQTERGKGYRLTAHALADDA